MKLTEEKKQLPQGKDFWDALPDSEIMRAWKEKIKRQEEAIRVQEEQERLRQESIERSIKHRHMQENSIRYFMKEALDLRFDPKEKTPSAVLYDGYCKWCGEQDIFPETMRTFCLNLKKNARDYKIAPTNFIWQGRHIRGFRGVALTEGTHT